MLGRRRDSESRLQEQRSQQIESLKTIVPGLKETSTDQSQFEVPVSTPSRAVMMRIFLPANFPNEKPVLQMLAQIRHPWLNTFFQVTGHPMLLSWGPHCNISTVVLDVMSQFAAAGDAPQGQQPPPGYAVAAPAAAGRQYSAANPFGPGTGAAGGAPPLRPAPQLRKDSSARHTPLPPVPGSFPDLEGAPLTQLNRLLNDEVAFDAYFAAMEPVINFKALHRDLLKGNAELAQTCLAEGEAQGAQHAEVLALQAALRDLRDQHRGKLGAAGLGGDPRREHLGRAARARDRAEAASDARAAAFEDGSVSADQVDSFIEDFMDKRQRYHQLAAKLEHVQLTDVPR